MGKVMDLLAARVPKPGIPAPLFAVEGRELYARGGDLPCETRALSPSDAGIATMLTRIQQQQLPTDRKRRLRVPTLKENDASVVLAVRVGNESVLLGADLQERGAAGLGWQVILDHYPAGGDRFDGFKIPHHGSSNGHHPQIWPRLMREETWAAVTPFNRLANRLPSRADCDRILQTAKHAYISAAPGLNAYQNDREIVGEIELNVALEMAEEPGRQGQIRLRKETADAASEWTVQLFGNAAPLAALVDEGR
jgi:hypothetical protein